MEQPLTTSPQSAPRTQRIRRAPLEQTSQTIIAAAIDVHSKLGPGLLESVYQTCTTHYLREAKQNVLTELGLPVVYRGVTLQSGFRIDMLVNRSVIVEVKAIENILPIHQAQLLSYLR